MTCTGADPCATAEDRAQCLEFDPNMRLMRHALKLAAHREYVARCAGTPPMSTQWGLDFVCRARLFEHPPNQSTSQLPPSTHTHTHTHTRTQHPPPTHTYTLPASCPAARSSSFAASRSSSSILTRASCARSSRPSTARRSSRSTRSCSSSRTTTTSSVSGSCLFVSCCFVLMFPMLSGCLVCLGWFVFLFGLGWFGLGWLGLVCLAMTFFDHIHFNQTPY